MTFIPFKLFYQIDVTLKVLDKDPRSRLHRKVPHARVEIGLDDRGVTELTTDKNGEATFQASTDLQRLSLRITDASEVHQPSFELHDSENFLKEGEVHIELLERSVSTYLLKMLRLCKDKTCYSIP